MTQRTSGGPVAEPSFDGVWAVPEADVASGRIPGYVAALRIGGQTAVRAGGRTAVEAGSAPMAEDTPFRIASVTKPIGSALALSLVQDGVLALDDPIARWLPEMERPRALVAPDAPLDRTTEARRAITVRHLLTFTAGWGAVMEPTPLQAAMMERGVYPGPLMPQMSGDEFVARVAGLPLAFHPGEGWLYDTPMDVLGVVLARAAGRPLSKLFAERITRPLGMDDTRFFADDPARLPPLYTPDADGLRVLDPPDGIFASPPAFEELGSGLVSTAPDVLRFFCAMADGGAPVLSPGSLALMTSDALTDDQRRQALPIVGPGGSWGLGTGVDVEAAEPGMARGRWGWTGGTGTAAYVDPTRDTVAVILTQRAMTGPQDGFGAFAAAVAAAAEAGAG
jgi:CubicO group peptidase (beta-lactamase class C family)